MFIHASDFDFIYRQFLSYSFEKICYFKSVNTVYEIAVSSLSDFKNLLSNQKGLH